MIDEGEAPHDETQLVHRDLLEVPSDVLTDMVISVGCLHEVETWEEQEVVLG